MKYLITGSQGCIGAWIVKNLVERGTPVVGFDMDADYRRLQQLIAPGRLAQAKFVRGDIRDLDALTTALRDEGVTHIIHLAGVQVPTCRRDPLLGAAINVVGTLNVFEAAKRAGGIQAIAYASSAAVFGPQEAYGGKPVPNDARLLPTTHYGVFKQCNEGNAGIYFQDDGISSFGLRPYTVYGPGRDVGMTADITKAIKASVAGRPFHIRFGGITDAIYVDDTARAFIHCAESGLPGARAYNIRGSVVRVQEEFIPQLESAVPSARGAVTCAATQLPIAPDADDSVLRADIPAFRKTPLADGIAATVQVFERLRREQRLDLADLDV